MNSYSAFAIVVAGVAGLLAPSAPAGDCPALDPQDDGTGLPTPLVISEIEPGAYIELFNTTSADIDLSVENFWLCSPFIYASVPSMADGVVIAAGGYATIGFPPTFTDSDAGGEIILFRDINLPPDFANSELIVDFVCWGENPHFSRKGQAESVGKWSGDCPGAIVDGALHRLPATGGTGAGDYAVSGPPSPENCVPDDASPGDTNGDGVVDLEDLVNVILGWGPCPESGACPGDTDGNGEVGTTDLFNVLFGWG